MLGRGPLTAARTTNPARSSAQGLWATQLCVVAVCLFQRKKREKGHEYKDEDTGGTSEERVEHRAHMELSPWSAAMPSPGSRTLTAGDGLHAPVRAATIQENETSAPKLPKPALKSPVPAECSRGPAWPGLWRCCGLGAGRGRGFRLGQRASLPRFRLAHSAHSEATSRGSGMASALSVTKC